MRKYTLLMKNWKFTKPGCPSENVDLPHTWNAIDGQDGGNDYWRGCCQYEKHFDAPEFDRDRQCVYIQFEGVNSSADVLLNGKELIHHDGGYSTFRAEITAYLKDKDNELIVMVDNGVNDRVYPQKADFTFYGGIYRDVSLIVLDKNHFSLDHLGGPGIEVVPQISEDNLDECIVNVKTFITGAGVAVISLFDAEDKLVGMPCEGASVSFDISKPHLWNGLKDPYLYRAKAELLDSNGQAYDEIEVSFGIRTFKASAKNGFYLNGKPYPLYGVSRHQDRKGIGNAITKEMHEEDMALIKEMGCNSIRLAHYQHDQYFYDLCDRVGMVVWAEIPYISEHMPNGRENTISQMKELITQNLNHASIICWGISNEITISTKDKADMLDNHKALNDLCHSMDPTRLTTLACYAMCGPFNKVAHITDLVSWNLYLGWYVPGLKLNDLWLDFFHKTFPNRLLGYSEYGAEGMPNLHSDKPHRGDHTEEYQAIYHEYMLECFKKRPWMWATHVWNMFDFAADARDQGGEPGMNHKGLVTFDRKIKKDSFYLYKAYWSEEPFVHICSKRFKDRTGDRLKIKVYSNEDAISLFVNGKKQEVKRGGPVFTFDVPFIGDVHIEAKAVSAEDHITDVTDFNKVDRPNPEYILKSSNKSANWV